MSYAQVKAILCGYKNYKIGTLDCIRSLNDTLLNIGRAGVLPGCTYPEKYQREINQLQCGLNNYEAYIKDLINHVKNETHRNIIYDKYINGLTWEMLAEKYNYSITRIYEINRASIKNISEEMINNNIPFLEFG